MIRLPNRAPLLKPAGFARINPAHPLARHVMLAHFMYRRSYGDVGPTYVVLQDSSVYQLDSISSTLNNLRQGLYGNEVQSQGFATIFDVADAAPLRPTSGAITIIARVKSTATGSRQWVCIKGNNPISYWLNVSDPNGTGDGCGFYNGGYFVSGKTRDIGGDNQWHVVAGTIKTNSGGATSDAAYYIDGRLDKLATGLASTMPANTDIFRVGFYAGDASTFKGSIESLVLLNIALTPAQVAALSADLYSLIVPTRRMFFGSGSALVARPRIFVCT